MEEGVGGGGGGVDCSTHQPTQWTINLWGVGEVVGGSGVLGGGGSVFFMLVGHVGTKNRRLSSRGWGRKGMI